MKEVIGTTAGKEGGETDIGGDKGRNHGSQRDRSHSPSSAAALDLV